ncbi:hypothetical protein KFL_007690010, partial [Klebsormidium nitens]
NRPDEQVRGRSLSRSSSPLKSCARNMQDQMNQKHEQTDLLQMLGSASPNQFLELIVLIQVSNAHFNQRRSNIATGFREKLYELVGHSRLSSTAHRADVPARVAALAELAASKTWLRGG